MSFLSAAWALTVLWALGALALGAGHVRASDWRTHMVAEFVTGVVILGFLGSLLVAVGARLSILPVYVLVISPQEITWLLVTSLPRVLGALIPATLFLTVLSVFARPAEPIRGTSTRVRMPVGAGAESAEPGVRPARSPWG